MKACSKYSMNRPCADCPMREPRLLSVEEVRCAEPGANLWFESWSKDEDGEYELVELAVVAPDGIIHTESSWFYVKRYDPVQTDTYRERVWTARPSDELRKATPWT